MSLPLPSEDPWQDRQGEYLELGELPFECEPQEQPMVLVYEYVKVHILNHFPLSTDAKNLLGVHHFEW